MTRLVLEENTRQSMLHAALDERFFEFVAGLPEELRELASSKSTYLGAPEQEAFESMSQLNPVLVSTPWMFWETFCELEDEMFLLLSEAGAYFVLASIVVDHLVDGQAEQPEATAVFHQALYARGLACFGEVFPSSSAFWSHFDRLSFAHRDGLANELMAQRAPASLTLEKLVFQAHGKVSPIVTTMAGFAHATGQAHILDPIEESLKDIAVASQLLDDIGDWEEDHAVRHATFYLTRLAPLGSWERQKWPDLDAMRRRLEAEWLDLEYLRLVMDWLDKSIRAVKGVACSAWKAYVRGYQELTDKHMTRAVARHMRRLLQPLIRDSRS